MTFGVFPFYGRGPFAKALRQAITLFMQVHHSLPACLVVSPVNEATASAEVLAVLGELRMKYGDLVPATIPVETCKGTLAWEIWMGRE